MYPANPVPCTMLTTKAHTETKNIGITISANPVSALTINKVVLEYGKKRKAENRRASRPGCAPNPAAREIQGRTPPSLEWSQLIITCFCNRRKGVF